MPESVCTEAHLPTSPTGCDEGRSFQQWSVEQRQAAGERRASLWRGPVARDLQSLIRSAHLQHAPVLLNGRRVGAHCELACKSNVWRETSDGKVLFVGS